MQALFAMLRRLEGSLVSTLIEGESGTGKEMVARAIHAHSLVQDGPFVAVNCAAFDRALVRSELFGYARGAFTGATEARQGAFEAASGGTLFLDEVGELPLEVQPILLRALESGKVTRVGEVAERPVKVRVLSATNRKLADLVREGKFREDLYYRLLVVQVDLPPLRQRKEDIPLLASRFAAELGVGELPDDVVHDLSTRTWVGNVRELKNAVRAYVALGSLSVPSLVGSKDDVRTAIEKSVDLGRPYAEQKEALLETFLDVYVNQLLKHTRGNQSEAARISGLERSYLSKVVRRLAASRSSSDD